MRRFHDRRFDVLTLTSPAGIGIIDILSDDHPGGNHLQRPDDFLADLRHGIAALRAYKIRTRHTMLHLSDRHAFRYGVQRVFVLLMPFVRHDDGNILVVLFSTGIYFCFVKQETQLFCGRFFALLRGCAEPLVPGETQRFHEHFHLLFQTGNTLGLSQQFLIFLAGNGDCFHV